MVEYGCFRMGSSAARNAEFLNKKAAEGWKLISVSPVEVTEGNGALTKILHAYMEKEAESPKDGEQLITG